MLRKLALAAPIAALAALACSPGNATQDEDVIASVAFDTTRLRVATASDTIAIRVEIAATEQQKTLGLMERRSMPDDAGMLFLYESEQPAGGGFWMFRTRIPLDIAFMDADGVIGAIRQMAPCTSQLAAGCPTYESGVPFMAALEMNQGFFARRGIRTGDRVLLEELSARR
jgi:uncharacterized protein